MVLQLYFIIKQAVYYASLCMVKHKIRQGQTVTKNVDRQKISGKNIAVYIYLEDVEHKRPYSYFWIIHELRSIRWALLFTWIFQFTYSVCHFERVLSLTRFSSPIFALIQIKLLACVLLYVPSIISSSIWMRSTLQMQQ